MIRGGDVRLFVYESKVGKEGKLIIRARISEWLLRQVKAPLMTCVAVIDPQGNDLQRYWQGQP